MDEQLKSRLLDSMAANRLVTFTGAGLSMAQPSEVPSAWTLAQSCAGVYERDFGETLAAPCHTDIERLAEYFADRRQLESVFLGSVIEKTDIGLFMRKPNKGHEAIADMLACSAIEANVSTNVDTLIEVAAENLGEPIARIAVTRNEAVSGTQFHKPHVKLHGCFRRSMRETLWCREQITRPPFDSRIGDFSQWLPNVLLDKDVVFVGFWTDWAYLNRVFEEIVGHSIPRLMILVNPSEFTVLEQKAPILSSFVDRPQTEFVHVRESGADFLDELRRGMGERFMRILLNRGVSTYETILGTRPTRIQYFTGVDTHSLYQWRRDSTGTPQENIVRLKAPDDSMTRLAVTHLRLQEMGGVIENDAYQFRGRRVRLIHGAGRYLAQIQKMFARASSLSDQEDIVICVGADDTMPLPVDITKGANKINVVNRGARGEWITEAMMQTALENLPQNHAGGQQEHL